MGTHGPGEGHHGNPWCVGEALEQCPLFVFVHVYIYRVSRADLEFALCMPSTGIGVRETSLPAEADFMLCI